MIFIVLIALGILGIAGTLWLSSRTRNYGSPTAPTEIPWYAISPEKIESAIGVIIQTKFRELLKIILHWLIGNYREISRKITIKQELKNRVRAFLYEHREDTVRNPSAMWGHLRNNQHKPTSSQEISPDEIISSES